MLKRKHKQEDQTKTKEFGVEDVDERRTNLQIPYKIVL